MKKTIAALSIESQVGTNVDAIEQLDFTQDQASSNTTAIENLNNRVENAREDIKSNGKVSSDNSVAIKDVKAKANSNSSKIDDVNQKIDSLGEVTAAGAAYSF